MIPRTKHIASRIFDFPDPFRPNKISFCRKKVCYSDGIECGIPFIDGGSHGITFEAVDNKFVDFHLAIGDARGELPSIVC